MVERPAVAVGREDLAGLVLVPAAVGDLDGDAAGQRHVALSGQQVLHGQVCGHERGGARGLHVDRGALQVEQVAGASDQEVLVVAGVAQQEHAHVVDQVGVAEQVEREVGAHAAATEHADGPVERAGRVRGVFQCLPADLQELAVLRVHDGRVLR
jgi:hypothetical protein